MFPSRASVLSSPLSSPSAAIAVKTLGDGLGDSRFLPCICCLAQGQICSRCDRGNVCCSPECARAWRREVMRRAGARYRRTEKGRLAGVARIRRFRLVRREDVTHPGSPNSGAEFIVRSSAADPPSGEPAGEYLNAGAPAETSMAAGHFPEEVNRAPIPEINRPASACQTPNNNRCAICGRPCRPQIRLGTYKCRGRHFGRACPYRGGRHPTPRCGIGPRSSRC